MSRLDNWPASLRILYVGPTSGTCLQRAEALRDLGHLVVHVASGIPVDWVRNRLYALASRMGAPPDLFGANRAIRRAIGSGRFDVLWIDKGLSITARALAHVRRASPHTVLVSYSPDDMSNPANRSRHYVECIPLFDLHVTTKSYNMAELREAGARDVLFVDNAYDPKIHRPIELSAEEQQRFSAEVGFIGFHEAERAAHILGLARAGIPVAVHGLGWERLRGSDEKLIVRTSYVDGLEYSKAINATRINLGFLRKVNRDLQTTRSVEIPACGAFMLAERTDEHLRLFEEGKEAEFFGSFDELFSKCRYYMEHEAERRKIAAAGLRRCVMGRYSNQGRLKGVLEHVQSLRFR